MELLITASIGLYKQNGDYFIQVITPHEDYGKANGNYLIPISESKALHISQYDGIEIEEG